MHSSAETPLILVAPDSFKGTMSAQDAARAIDLGWRSVRPHDDVRRLPQADGGEGTAEAIDAAVPGCVWHRVPDVCGPDLRPVEGQWLELPDGTAVVELAQMSGITLMRELDPEMATTFGFGQVIADALARGARRLVLCLGGSASNEGGAGAMRALGARLLDARGNEIGEGAKDLADVRSVDLSSVMPAPRGGVTVLTDVTSPLLGPHGATAVFGAQKGIVKDDVPAFERSLERVAEALPHVSPMQPGMGAAGGTAFGLAALWPVTVASGARHIAEITGLAHALPLARLLITGEGRYDSQSDEGKVVGELTVAALAHGVAVAIVAGRIEAHAPGLSVDLSRLAGSAEAAMAAPVPLAYRAGALLAERHTRTLVGGGLD